MTRRPPDARLCGRLPPPGASPDAVNLWIGNHLSTTWVHKDPYENLYTVISGEKHFTLFPPCDYPWLYEEKFPAGVWERDTTATAIGQSPRGLLRVARDDPPQTVPWIAVRRPGHCGEREPRTARAV